LWKVSFEWRDGSGSDTISPVFMYLEVDGTYGYLWGEWSELTFRGESRRCTSTKVEQEMEKSLDRVTKVSGGKSEFKTD
jgi:hypothetical protein